MCSHLKTQLIPSYIERPVVLCDVRTHGLEWTWSAGVSQNGTDHMVRTQKVTHGSEWTLCAGVSQNGADYMVRTQKRTPGPELT